MDLTNNTNNTAVTVTLHSAHKFVGPCMLESGLMHASTVTREWLNSHKKFNALYDGRNLVLTAINNEDDMLVTSEIVTIESSGAWAKLTSRNSTINIWDEGAYAALQAAKATYPVPMPKMPAVRKLEACLSEYEKQKIARKALGGYEIGTYRPVSGKPFGFISSASGDVFAYGLGNQEMGVIFKAIETSKGLRVSEWRRPTAADYLNFDDAVTSELNRKQAELDTRARGWAEEEYRETLTAWIREKTFFEEYGFYCVEVKRYSKNNYGSAQWEDYQFSRDIGIIEFITYLRAMNINLKPETVDAPVCQGDIRLYRDGYTWATTGNSNNWTRYESFCYYD